MPQDRRHTARRTCGPVRCLLAAATLLSLWDSALWAQTVTNNQPAPAPDTGFAVVRVDLRRNVLLSVLPFDVPVQIEGTVPAKVNFVEVRVQQVAEDLACDPQDEQEWEKAFRAVWSLAEVFRPTAITQTTADNTFSISLPPFQAESFYCFRFLLAEKPPMSKRIEAAKRALVGLTEQTRGGSRENVQRFAEQVWDESLANLHSQMEGVELQSLSAATVPDSRTVSSDLKPPIRMLLKDREEQVQENEEFDNLQAQVEGQSESLRDLARSVPLEESSLLLRRSTRDAAETLDMSNEPVDIEPLSLLTAQEADELVSFYTQLVISGREGVQDLSDTSRERGGDSDAASAWAASALEIADEADDLLAKTERQSIVVRDVNQKVLQSIDTAAEVIAEKLDDIIGIRGTSRGNASTQFTNYVSADVGFLYGWDIEEAVPYVGVNFYFRPVNKDASLRAFGDFGRRFAVTLGLTTNADFKDEDGTRLPLFNSQALLLGGGLRLSPSLRVGLGALVFKEKDPNPLSNDTSIGVSPYVSLTFDVNVVGLFKGLASNLFPQG